MVTTTTKFKVVTAVEPGKPGIDNLKINPTVVKAGSRFTVSYRISNTGRGPMTGTSTVKFTCPGPACIPEKHMPRKVVPAGGNVTESVALSMPPTAVAGEYTITATYEAITMSGTPNIPPSTPPYATAMATLRG